MDEKLKTFSDFFAMDTEAMNLAGDFFTWMKSPEGAGLGQEEASPLAHDADRYLRDFLVDIMEKRPDASDAATVSSYLGNWYVVNTLEPSHEEIDRIVRALKLLHRFLAEKGTISTTAGMAVLAALKDPAFFHARLEEFWALKPDGIAAWREIGEYRKGRAGEFN